MLIFHGKMQSEYYSIFILQYIVKCTVIAKQQLWYCSPILFYFTKTAAVRRAWRTVLAEGSKKRTASAVRKNYCFGELCRAEKRIPAVDFAKSTAV